jgi:hypothetical protein
VTVGDDTRTNPGDLPADRSTASSPPALVADPAAGGTGLILFPGTDCLPAVWVGPVPATGLEPDDVAALLAVVRPCSLLPQHGAGWFGRPGLSGHRLGHGASGPEAGGDWSPLFRSARLEHNGRRAQVEAADKAAGLRLATVIESVPGGAIRARHTLTNLGRRGPVCTSPPSTTTSSRMRSPTSSAIAARPR